jgi:drug/metabolite transporter (DMT)-like permease
MNRSGLKEQSRNGYQTLSDSDTDSDNNKIRTNTFWGYALGCICMLLATTSLASSQALDQFVPHSELNGLRFTAQIAMISPLVIGHNKCDVQVERKSIGWLVVASLLLTLSSYCHYGAVYYLPLGVSSGITCSLVLITNNVISCIVTKSTKWYVLVASITCLLGVIMTTQPPFLFHKYSETAIHNMTGDDNNTWVSPCRVTNKPSTLFNRTNNTLSMNYELHDEKHDMMIGYVLCVVGAFCTVTYMNIVNRKLANINVYTYNFWVCFIGISSSFAIMAATEKPVFPNNGLCIAILIMHSSSAGLTAILLYRVYQLVDPVLASLILTLRIALAFIAQFTVLSGIHPGHINVIGIIGAVFVFAGNACIPVYQVIHK